MPLRRTSSVTAMDEMDDTFHTRLDGLGPRPSSYAPVRPSMLDALSPKADQTRPRSLSADSDSNKQRPSVPLLYASAISSMSTLSSTFYQYDSTDGAPTPIPTPSSHISSVDTTPSVRRPPHESFMKLPAAQERAIVADAKRLTKELIVESLRGLVANSKRQAIVKRHVSTDVLVASAKDVRVYANFSSHDTANSKSKKTRRYTAQTRIHATLEEVLAILQRDDDNVELYNSYQSLLFPETVHCKTLWRGGNSSGQSSTTQLTMEDLMGDDDSDIFDAYDPDLVSVDMADINDDEDEFVFHSERGRGTFGGGAHPPRKISVASHKSAKRGRPSVVSTQRRQRPASTRDHHASSRSNWLGINWWVQHMPNKLSRDRDFVVLEKQSEFATSEARSRRGFVHLRHSVDIADMSRKLSSPFVRGHVIHSGLVIVEAEEPGTLDVSHTLEIEFAGHLGAGQYRQLVIKRLLQIELLEELLWKNRLLKSQLLWTPRTDKSSDKKWHQCDRCQFRASRFSRRALAPCKVCDRVVCNNCSNVWAFPPRMVENACHKGRLPLEADAEGGLRARVCTHCVSEHSRPPRLPARSQPVMQTNTRVLARESEYSHHDEEDDVDLAPLNLQRPTLQRADTWEPSRSSRIAEDLVDDFLMSFSPTSGPLLTAAVQEQESKQDHHYHHAPTVKLRPASQPMSSRPSEDPTSSDDAPVPRRKLSIFELIPEPAPRKNVVLYEA